MEVSLRVKRFDPSVDVAPHYERYDVPSREGMTVLDALIYVKDRLDHGLAVRFSCRMASCGSCGMKVNGKPRLACETQLGDLGPGAATVEPMDNFPVVRDLVVDLESFFSRHTSLSPRLLRKRDEAEQESPSGEYLMFPAELESMVQFTYCIKCGLCSSSCPTASTDGSFPGPQALAQAYRYLADPRDEGGKERVEAVDTAHGVWRCHFAGTCSAVCPKGVDPALGIQLLKRHVMAATSPLSRKKGEKTGAEVFKNPNAGLVG
ncbi:MAG TPA: succinate dehydrogenase/fumarate reductase iron-sulfur subunit [Nitrososphaerales archaeon]|nr:succinate dehydrogenase/fumarate reductase iron-sulfur subunit [Nitrososphaerales archaeon]HUK75290.1 succinate dehydrogenase/fumarate reductase iron-sulfur subunit [Nitrososphaerales archaeon]